MVADSPASSRTLAAADVALLLPCARLDVISSEPAPPDGRWAYWLVSSLAGPKRFKHLHGSQSASISPLTPGARQHTLHVVGGSAQEAQRLCGRVIEIHDGVKLTVGRTEEWKPSGLWPVLESPFVCYNFHTRTPPGHGVFCDRLERDLWERGVPLNGGTYLEVGPTIQQNVWYHDQLLPFHGRAVRLFGVTPEAAQRLQRFGLGTRRRWGFGFLRPSGA